MNSKLLYLEIGNIDDELIQEASEVHVYKKRRHNFIYFAGAAACICLMCVAVLFGMNNDIIYFVERDIPAATKVLVPAEENTTVVQLTYQELFEHYGLNQFPDTFSDLHRSEQSYYYIYHSSDNLMYDVNILQYRTIDGEKMLSVMISKDKSSYDAQADNAVKSRISGVPLVLFKSDESALPVYGAEMCYKDVYLSIVSYGMEGEEFTNSIRALVKSQK